MADQSPLIVPMTVEAFVVNNPDGNPTSYVNSEMDYALMLDELVDAQDGISSPGTPEGNPSFYNGVYLKWRLPAAFTTGVQDGANGLTVFPPVPNRWIVVRSSGESGATTRTVTGWIVVSDAANPGGESSISGKGSAYISPQTAQQPAHEIVIGTNVPLSSGWSEPGTLLHLTAVAPGNHAFAYFQPACNNVFSFIDTSLQGQTNQRASYMVAGWFSAPTDDPLANAAENFAKVIASLGWAVTDQTSVATSTLAYGFVDNVTWDTPPASTIPNPESVKVAIGNTSIEALTSLVTATTTLDAPLLEALQLDMVENLDQPDGQAMLQQKLQASFFKRYGGGYTWIIVGAPHSGQPKPEELAKEAALLTTLNAAQLQLDDDLQQLASLRSQLYVVWWKTVTIEKFKDQQPSNPIVTLAQLKAQLDPSTSGSIASQVLQLMNAAKSSTVPTGSTAKELQASIREYEKNQGLPSSRVLKRTSNPAFYESNNPVVLVSGANANGIARTPKQVACRFGFAGTTELISTFTFANKSFPTSKSAPPPLSLANITGTPAWWSSAVQALYLEFFLLDPTNAPQIAAALGQSKSESAIELAIATPTSANYSIASLPDPTARQYWTANPWHPLYLAWSTQYTPIPYGAEGENWTFQDGQYTWNGSGLSEPNADLGPNGLIILASTAELNMQARINAFINNNPNLPQKQLDAFNNLLSDVNWDLLSQSLDGFNEQLQLGQPGAFLSPSSAAAGTTTPSLPALLGGTGSYPPNIGSEVPAAPPTTPSNFQPWRAGQLVITSLTIVDEWGQSLPVVVSRDETVYGPDELQPQIVSNDAVVRLANGRFIDAIVSPATNSELTITSLSLSSSVLTVNGTGFEAFAAESLQVMWNGQSTNATTISSTQLTASVTTTGLTGLIPVTVTTTPPENLTDQSNPFQLPPALLQPAQLDFSLIDATNDSIPFGPANPKANPICGWVVPNHLDHSLFAFDAAGRALGELIVEVTGDDRKGIRWSNAPFSPYPKGLPQIQKEIPHFGDFLVALSKQHPRELTRLLEVIDDTFWTTLPSSASFDQNLAVFMGRPLALVRASLQFLLDGPAQGDPSWQYTFDPQTPAVTAYQFGIQLGDVARLEDGLIGYFTGDDYDTFNVVQQTAAADDDYLKLIGLGNYISQPFDGTTVTYISMLVDPRAAVHATTGILPTVTATLPLQFVSAAMARMSVSFRVSGALTDQIPATAKTPAMILMPTRREPGAGWHWLEKDGETWTRYAVGPNDTNARLSPTLPVLRDGLLNLSLKGVAQ